jgi:hypothetical protein
LEGKLICLFYTSQQTNTGTARQQGREGEGQKKKREFGVLFWKFGDMP